MGFTMARNFTKLLFMRYFSLLFVLLLNLSLWALPSESTVLVEGIVTNKLTAMPIKGAHVIYTRIATGADPAASPISRDTDVQGRFHL